ncbi:hypothetical protein LG326_12300 [Metaplanococcus flavidus]
MDEKKNMIKLLESELDILISRYEKNINEKDLIIQQLKEEISELHIEKKMIEKELENKKSTEIEVHPVSTKLSNEKEVAFNPDFDEIDSIIASNSSEAMEKLLATALRMWRRLDIEKLTYILEQLNGRKDLVRFSLPEYNKNLTILIKSILLKENLNELEHDRLINETLDIGIQLKGTLVEADIEKFLKKYNKKIHDNIIQRNEPSLIRKYLRLLLVFNLKEKVHESINYLLDVEWGFLDASLVKTDFEFFLWYSYLFNLEEKMLEKSNLSLKWYSNKSKELFLYFIIKKEKKINSDLFKMNINRFKNSTLLMNFEQELILKKISQDMESKSLIETKTYNLPIYIINKSDYPEFNAKYSLSKEYVKLPMYKKENTQQVYLYTEAEVLISKSRQLAFLYKEDFIRLMKEKNPLIFKTANLNYEPLKDKIKNEKFTWPSTEISPKESSSQNEEKSLNETSELKKLGYQITGTTRSQRWQALEKAVPKLGLKKVVHIISYNIKLRKGQKNGLKKFSFAISEWEHDLTKLKKHYYKQDFKWPESK